MEKKKFNFVVPSIYKGLDAETAYNELERIREKYGDLSSELVVDESRSEDSVLHNCFQWDDTLAAESWRREQARQLIKNITVTIVSENIETTIRAIVNVSSTTEFRRTYVPIADAIADEESYNDLLNQAKREMQSFVLKYSQISELNNVKAEMLKAMDDNQ